MSALPVARICQKCDMSEAVTIFGQCDAISGTFHAKQSRVCPAHLTVFDNKGAFCGACHDKGALSPLRYEVLEVQP